MVLLSSVLFSATVLLLGAILGTAVLRSGLLETATDRTAATRVAPPKVGGTGSHRQGPWPECLGLAGADCVALIEGYAEDVRGHVHVVPADGMVTMDFRTDRVRVFVDEDGIVQRVPSRG